MTARLQTHCLIRYRWSAKRCVADLACPFTLLSPSLEEDRDVAKHHTSSFIKCDCGRIKVSKICKTSVTGRGYSRKGLLSLIVQASWLLGQLDKEQRLNIANKCQQLCGGRHSACIFSTSFAMRFFTFDLFLSLH